MSYNKQMKDLNPSKLHHAYILEGDIISSHKEIVSFCEDKLSLNTKSNPDFWHSHHERFLVSDARNLREMQLKKTSGGEKKIFIISFNFITREAQNSLLKVLEEPTQGTHIFLLTQSAHVFLDTVKSRAITISFISDERNKQAEDFLKSSYKERLSIVGKIVDDIKKEKLEKSDALKMVRSIKEIVYKDFNKNPVPEISEKLKEINRVEDYLHDSGSSTKMLLENLAISI